MKNERKTDMEMIENYGNRSSKLSQKSVAIYGDGSQLALL